LTSRLFIIYDVTFFTVYKGVFVLQEKRRTRKTKIFFRALVQFCVVRASRIISQIILYKLISYSHICIIRNSRNILYIFFFTKKIAKYVKLCIFWRIIFKQKPIFEENLIKFTSHRIHNIALLCRYL
jgi:hypothetical protein